MDGVGQAIIACITGWLAGVGAHVASAAAHVAAVVR